MKKEEGNGREAGRSVEAEGEGWKERKGEREIGEERKGKLRERKQEREEGRNRLRTRRREILDNKERRGKRKWTKGRRREGEGGGGRQRTEFNYAIHNKSNIDKIRFC